MEIEFLLGERALPIQTVSVRLAATIFTYELGRWNEIEFTYAEIEPFMSSESGPGGRGVTLRTHAWEFVSLAGNPRRARDAIESLICKDIDSGRLPALQVRRDLNGTLVATDTLIDIGKMLEWGDTYEMLPGDWWQEYQEAEGEIANRALSAIQEGREQLQNARAFEERKARARALDEDQILDILRENERLRAITSAEGKAVKHIRPLRSDARETYLKIIRALLELAGIGAHGATSRIFAKLKALGFDVDPSKPDAVEKLLKAARELIPENKRVGR